MVHLLLVSAPSAVLSGDPNSCPSGHKYTDKKENLIFLKYKEIQSGAAAKSHMRRKDFLIYEGMRKYIFPKYMKRPLVIYDFATAPF
jgi:hypothetical protein